jgi:hypothetical protein
MLGSRLRTTTQAPLCRQQPAPTGPSHPQGSHSARFTTLRLAGWLLQPAPPAALLAERLNLRSQPTILTVHTCLLTRLLTCSHACCSCVTCVSYPPPVPAARLGRLHRASQRVARPPLSLGLLLGPPELRHSTPPCRPTSRR